MHKPPVNARLPWIAIAWVTLGACQPSDSVSIEISTEVPWLQWCQWYQSETVVAGLSEELLEDVLVITSLNRQGRQVATKPCIDPSNFIGFWSYRSHPDRPFEFQVSSSVTTLPRLVAASQGLVVERNASGGYALTPSADGAGSSLQLYLPLEDCFSPADDNGNTLLSSNEPECRAETRCVEDRTGCADFKVEPRFRVESADVELTIQDSTWELDGRVLTRNEASVTPGLYELWLRDLPPGTHTVGFRTAGPFPGRGSLTFTAPVSQTNTERVLVPLDLGCTNGLDDDANGRVDCDDPVCAEDAACAATEVCDDGRDNDRDGSVDCQDPDCATNPHCIGGEDCENGVDDNCDALVDCDDPECETHAACTVEVCDNGVDDDADNDVDCDDADCSQDAACVAGGCAPEVVVSGVYVEGGTQSASYAEDFVELRNRGSSPVDLTGLYLHVLSSNQTWDVIDLAGHTIPGDAFFLVQLDTPGQYTGVPLSPPPDLVQTSGSTSELDDVGGGLVLSTSPTPAAAQTCPTSDVVDAVGLYSPSFCGEAGWVGGSTTPAQVYRRTDACVDTDDNGADFGVVAVVAPRGTSTLGNGCYCP